MFRMNGKKPAWQRVFGSRKAAGHTGNSN